MLEQQNAKGSNFLFMQNNSGLLGLKFLKTELCDCSFLYKSLCWPLL